MGQTAVRVLVCVLCVCLLEQVRMFVWQVGMVHVCSSVMLMFRSFVGECIYARGACYCVHICKHLHTRAVETNTLSGVRP